jgi:hypothetical protein
MTADQHSIEAWDQMRRTAEERRPGGLPSEVVSVTRSDADVAPVDVDDGGANEDMTRDTVCRTRPATMANVAVFVRSAAQSSCARITVSAATDSTDALSETAAPVAAVVASSSPAHVYAHHSAAMGVRKTAESAMMAMSLRNTVTG